MANARYDAAEARTIGLRLWRIRDERGKSLEVIGGLAGMSASTLFRIEHGLRPVTLPEIVALASALQVAPSELTTLPVPAPANGHTDATIEAVRLALDAIESDQPGGLVLPVAALAHQVVRIDAELRACRFAGVATKLPGLIRTVHATLGTGGADHGQVLQWAVYLHVHVTRKWLTHAAAPTDLVRRAVFLAQRLAQKRDELTTLAVAGFGVAHVLLLNGARQAGQAKLNSITLPPTTTETAGLVARLTHSSATAAVQDGRPGDAAAPLGAAAELAERFGATGDIDSLGFCNSPTAAGQAQMWLALESNDPDRAVSIAQGVNPERHRLPLNRVFYWIYYSRALAQLRGRRDDAVRALRAAEDLFPTKVHRDPIVREVIASLLPGTPRNDAGKKLRAMAHRVGLPV